MLEQTVSVFRLDQQAAAPARRQVTAKPAAELAWQ